MKKIRNLILFIVLIAAVLFIVGRLKNPGKNDDSQAESAEEAQVEQSGEAEDARAAEIRQLEARFLTACHEVDVEGILDCLSPSLAKPMRPVLLVAGEDQVLALLCQILGADSASDHREVCRTLDTELSGIEVTGDEATADLHYTYEQDGKLYGADADVEFKYIDGRWYLSSLKGK